MVKEVTNEFQETQSDTEQHGCPHCFSVYSHFGFGIIIPWSVVVNRSGDLQTKVVLFFKNNKGKIKPDVFT